MDVLDKLERDYEKEKNVEYVIPEDVILSLLYASDKPIINRTVMMKEVFLAYEDVLKKLTREEKETIKIVNPQFFGYKFGAFSYKIAEVIGLLVGSGLIEKTGRAKSVNEQFKLTEKGKKAIEMALSKSATKHLKTLTEILKDKRKRWDQFGREGIINYTYKLYPKYAEGSKIKNRYSVTIWGKLFSE